jgi:hypothetical protein
LQAIVDGLAAPPEKQAHHSINRHCPAALDHSTTKAKLKFTSGNGLYSFPIVFFWYFFGQAKKYIRGMKTIIKVLPAT